MAEPPVGPNVAVIPARGGSKRIPRKNIRRFLGVPILARTIGILHDSGLFDRIVVSTDDDEVASVAIDAGAEVPFRRARSLADDHSPTVPVIADAIEHLGREHLGPWVCCVYPTSVLLQIDDLRAAQRMLKQGSIDYVVPVTRFSTPVQRALRVGDDGRCEMLWSENLTVRTQDLEPTYHDAGQFYWGTTEAWLAGRPVFGPHTRAVVLPPSAVQDIDTEQDWVLAEQRFQLLECGGAT